LLKSLAGGDRLVVLVAQRDPEKEHAEFADLHGVGVESRVLNVVPMASDTANLIVFTEGLRRVRLLEPTQATPFLKARIEVLADAVPPPDDREFAALQQEVRDLFAEVVLHSPHLPNELAAAVIHVEDPAALSDFVAARLSSLELATRQWLLETIDVRARMKRLLEELVREAEKLRLQMKIRTDVQEKVAGQQRQFFLREQLKAIQEELGEANPEEQAFKELGEKLAQAGLPEEAKKEAMRELSRLESMSSNSAEYTVARTYLDWMSSLPWNRTTATEIDLPRAAQMLDEDHYDLERVKERILEHLAVLRLQPEKKGPILCFVGPPGTGKTSVGRSIARALGRSFVRLSLGGIHDEAEIRGHRRTYVGALPGQIVRSLRRAGARDPVFMLDEVDKLSRDFHGDPAAALLEVLDPEQNFAFLDHYLDVPFDLSKVLFITTANVLDPVPPALLDRMEVLELPGYTEEEKLEIARRYLVPRQLRENGLASGVQFDDGAIREIIRSYTREAGVRNLEREIGRICRKHARRVASEGPLPLAVTPEVARERLGAPRYHIETELAERTRRPGVAVALAWTAQGGDLLFVEASRLPQGKGEFLVTGQVGEVMQESMLAARSWLRANAHALGLDASTFRKCDLHVHVPAGAVPKDGPSAGVPIVAALYSLLIGRAVRPFLALTGEITLSGLVLPVGGIKEKVLAARRSGVREVVLPAENEANLQEDVPAHLRAGIQFHLVRTLEDVLERAFDSHAAGGAHAHETRAGRQVA